MSLNTDQLRAVQSNSSKILCIAGAGTGKTYTMISRIARLVEDGVDPCSILALTFTNAAAFEMKDRFIRMTNSSVVPEFRTFHSFCYSLLSTDASVRMGLGYKFTPKVAEPGEVKQIQTYCMMQLGLKQTLNQLFRATTPKDKDDLAAFNKAVSSEFRKRGLITFDVLCYGVGNMFVQNKPYIEKYHDKYKYIFVDEFQDTDPRQWQFVSSFEHSNLFIVGDALQAIYGFRGADSSIIKSISTDPDWEVIKLSENYRSSLEICNYANNNSKHAEDAYRVEIRSTKHGPKVMTSICRDGYKHVVDSTLLDTLNTIWGSVSEGTGAILCRTNAEVDTVCNYFAELGIDFSRDRANDEAIHTLRSAIDPKYALDWLLTYLTAEKYSEYIRMITIDGSADSPREELLAFIERYSKSKNVSDRWERISAVNEILYTNKCTETKWEDILSVLLDNISSEMVCPVMAEYASPETIVTAMISLLEEEQAHNLYIGTIHSSKGLEYDTVMLVNVGGYRFKVDSEENKNLLYVGITRAKTNLFISYCERN